MGTRRLERMANGMGASQGRRIVGEIQKWLQGAIGAQVSMAARLRGTNESAMVGVKARPAAEKCHGRKYVAKGRAYITRGGQ